MCIGTRRQVVCKIFIVFTCFRLDLSSNTTPSWGIVLSQLMIGFLLNNNLAPIGSSVISTCSPADLFEQRERNVPLASADVRGGGILRDEPKERLRRRLLTFLLPTERRNKKSSER